MLMYGVCFNLIGPELEGELEPDSTTAVEQESDLSQHSEKEPPDEVCTCGSSM